MEVLFVDLLLWKSGLSSDEKYKIRLRNTFQRYPKSDILIKLNQMSSPQQAYHLFTHYFNETSHPLNEDSFSKELYRHCGQAFETTPLTLKEFSQRCTYLYHDLPESLKTNLRIEFFKDAEGYAAYMNEEEAKKVFKQIFGSADKKTNHDDDKSQNSSSLNQTLIIIWILIIIVLFCLFAFFGSPYSISFIAGLTPIFIAYSKKK